MFRVSAGSRIARTVTIPGSGSLTTETFDADVVLPSGRRPSVSVSITDAAAREVTVTMAASEWRRGEGGMGALEVRMIKDGETTVEVSERFRVMRGLAPEYAEGYV
jgi:hypothetical protein